MSVLKILNVVKIPARGINRRPDDRKPTLLRWWWDRYFNPRHSDGRVKHLNALRLASYNTVIVLGIYETYSQNAKLKAGKETYADIWWVKYQKDLGFRSITLKETAHVISEPEYQPMFPLFKGNLFGSNNSEVKPVVVEPISKDLKPSESESFEVESSESESVEVEPSESESVEVEPSDSESVEVETVREENKDTEGCDDTSEKVDNGTS